MRGQQSLTLEVFRLLAFAALAAALSIGCQSAPRRSLARSEPTLAPVTGPGEGIAPAQTVTWVDRHPLFSKPREYYEKSGDNTFVKTAAATFIGIPAGVVGEVRQIVVGTPTPPAY